MKIKSKTLYFISIFTIVFVTVIMMAFVTNSIVDALFNLLGLFNSSDDNTIMFNFTLMLFVQDSLYWIGLLAGIYLASFFFKDNPQNIKIIGACGVVFYALCAYLMRFTSIFAPVSSMDWPAVISLLVLPVGISEYFAFAHKKFASKLDKS